MIFSILEAKVATDQWGNLKQEFEKMIEFLPEPIANTYLIQNTKAPDLWQLITIWKSMEALLEYRKTVKAPMGLLLFRKIGSEPLGTMNEVIASSDPGFQGKP